MKLSDFDYHLPAELIAQHPPAERTASRLLHLDGMSGGIHDQTFRDLPSLLRPHDLLVFNNTKVVKARLHGHKETGGSAEVLIERVLDNNSPQPSVALAHIRASKSPKPGSKIIFANSIVATMVQRVEDLFELHFEGGERVYDVLEKIGEVPLPPYITHQADAGDESRYQTIYAKHDGSVAAPTAGLHFDETLLDQIRVLGVASAYVTLHVGAGTFQPVRDDDISKHIMHSERYHVPSETVEAVAQAQAAGGRVIAVGTTSMRTLEAASSSGALIAQQAETQIFIKPGYEFKTVDRLITNFHLPKSTLMMLVAAFAGRENMVNAYRHAVEHRYRFFSYGDAMLIEKNSMENNAFK
jgi:S-adenosylmethionine:tRNA ribosyltransferase-isomerase